MTGVPKSTVYELDKAHKINMRVWAPDGDSGWLIILVASSRSASGIMIGRCSFASLAGNDDVFIWMGQKVSPGWVDQRRKKLEGIFKRLEAGHVQ